MSIRRICIVTRSAPATNPRLIKEVAALREAGFEVTVVCGAFGGWNDPYDDVLINSDTVHVDRILFGPKASWHRRLALSGPRKGADWLIRHTKLSSQRLVEIAYHDIVVAAERVASKHRADLYIAHYVAALPAVARAAKRNGALFAFDAEDYHLGDLPDESKYAHEKRMIRTIEAAYLPKAAYITAASPMIAEAYAAAYCLPRPNVILNVFSKSSAPKHSSRRGSVKPGPSLYWFSQVIGPDRGIDTAVHAIARARTQPHLYLRGTISSDYELELKRLANALGVLDRVHVLPPVSPLELELLGSEFDAGYIGELAETTNRQIALTNKLFSYLISGIPFLASDIPAHRQIADEMGSAILLFRSGDVVSLSQKIDTLLSPDYLAVARERAWLLGQSRFNWEYEKQHFLTVISNLEAAPNVPIS